MTTALVDLRIRRIIKGLRSVSPNHDFFPVMKHPNKKFIYICIEDNFWKQFGIMRKEDMFVRYKEGYDTEDLGLPMLFLSWARKQEEKNNE